MNFKSKTNKKVVIDQKQWFKLPVAERSKFLATTEKQTIKAGGVTEKDLIKKQKDNRSSTSIPSTSIPSIISPFSIGGGGGGFGGFGGGSGGGGGATGSF